MCDNDSPQVLTVGCDDAPENGSSFFAAESGKRALELLRLLRFDLVVTRADLPDGPAWNWIHRMRAAWPWQKWALVAGECSPQDEILARSLGVTRIFESDVCWDEVTSLAASIRRRSVLPAGGRIAPAAMAVEVGEPSSAP